MQIISAFTSESITLKSNYFFQIELNERDLEYTLTLHESSNMTHELVWEKINDLLEEVKKGAIATSDEYTILQCISIVNRRKKPIYPSRLRNIVNYQAYYGIKEIERKYSAANILDYNEDWLSAIIGFDNRKSDDDQQQINLFVSYVRYLYAFTFNLVNEYIERRGRKSGVLSSINKNRVNKITPPASIFTYN